ncbi:MAG: hypothetical protein HUJ68_06475 [Clostridia bacterium]|nr:hypothetical protein [Clostridia bacterium]
MFTLIFGCKQNSIVKRLCSGQMSMLVGAVGNTTVITDETAQIQTQELSEREKIIAKYNALRAETESKKNADIDQLHSRDES